jgi:anti-sigma-K factor RskA
MVIEGHEEFEELSALAALGAASAEEISRLEQHLRDCSDCATMDAENQRAASLLPFGLEPVTPPEEARVAILETIRRRDEDKVVALNPARSTPVWWLATAATFLLALFLWSELRLRAVKERVAELETARLQLSEENSRVNQKAMTLESQLAAIAAQSTRSIQLSGQEAAPSASARVFLDSQQRRAFVFFEGLPPNSGDKSYQLWIIPGGAGAAPMGAGVFDVSPDGEGRVVLENLPLNTEMKALAVTLEPRGGVGAPTTTPVLVGGV